MAVPVILMMADSLFCVISKSRAVFASRNSGTHARMDPRRLEKFADQAWMRSAAAASARVGPLEAAASFRVSRTFAAQHNHGRFLEKYGEDGTRVIQTAMPDALARGSALFRDEPRSAFGRGAGIPLVPDAVAVDAAAPAGMWSAPLQFTPSTFSVNHVRGPTLAVADVDCGPRFVIASAEGAPLRVGEGDGAAMAPPHTLLALSRGYAASAAATTVAEGGGRGVLASGGGDTGVEVMAVSHSGGVGGDADAGAGVGVATRTADGGARTLRPQFLQYAAPSVTTDSRGAHLPAGSGQRHTLAVSRAQTMLALQSSVDSQWDLSRTVAAQFGDDRRAASDVLGEQRADVVPVGRSQAVALPRSAARANGLLGTLQPPGSTADSAVPVGDLLSHLPIATSGSAFDAGAPVPDIRTVVHPLDAHPATRRAVNEAAVMASAAEKFRRVVAGAQRRRDYLTLARYPHGVIGVGAFARERRGAWGMHCEVFMR